MADGMTLFGDKALERKLKQLPDDIFRKTTRKAAAMSMTPVAKEARQRARAVADTGTLARSIGKRTKTYRRSGVVVTIVGPRKGFRELVGTRLNPFTRAFRTGEATRKVFRDPLKYAHLVEFMVRPHTIRKALGFMTVRHPGFAGRPFMRPSLDNNKGRVLSIFKTQIRAGLERFGREKTSRA